MEQYITVFIKAENVSFRICFRLLFPKHVAWYMENECAFRWWCSSVGIPLYSPFKDTTLRNMFLLFTLTSFVCVKSTYASPNRQRHSGTSQSYIHFKQLHQKTEIEFSIPFNPSFAASSNRKSCPCTRYAYQLGKTIYWARTKFSYFFLSRMCLRFHARSEYRYSWNIFSDFQPSQLQIYANIRSILCVILLWHPRSGIHVAFIEGFKRKHSIEKEYRTFSTLHFQWYKNIAANRGTHISE